MRFVKPLLALVVVAVFVTALVTAYRHRNDCKPTHGESSIAAKRVNGEFKVTQPAHRTEGC